MEASQCFCINTVFPSCVCVFVVLQRAEAGPLGWGCAATVVMSCLVPQHF